MYCCCLLILFQNNLFKKFLIKCQTICLHFVRADIGPIYLQSRGHKQIKSQCVNVLIAFAEIFNLFLHKSICCGTFWKHLNIRLSIRHLQ